MWAPALTSMRAACCSPGRRSLVMAAVLAVAVTAGCSASHPRPTPSTPPKSAGSSTSPVTVAVPTPATTVVTPPDAGNIHQTVPSAVQATNPAVPLSATAQFGGGVAASITNLKTLTTQANGPGEISGPGVQLTIRIDNQTSSELSVGSVAVNLQDANGTPGSPIDSATHPFSGLVAAGKSVTAVYVFNLPTEHRNPTTVSITYSTKAPVVLFNGDVQ